VRRRIVSFDQDEVGDWRAHLDCRHRQHVRHQPPFRMAPWVETAAGRAARIGRELDCPLCDRCELPDDLTLVRTTAEWDEHTVPAGLRRDHRVASGVWGRIVVVDGALRFVAATEPPTDVTLRAGDTQPIPPDVAHHVDPLGAVRFAVEFWS
jgi:tellurite methyltransferase